jgi:DNA polymerase III delta prime subunit
MQIIKCWDIQVWDGGERHYHRYYVKTKEAAEAWKKTNKFDEIYETEFVILDDLNEVEAFKNGELRKQALAKLTDVEKVVLGLK